MASPALNPRHLVVLAVAEGLVVSSVVLRLTLFPGQVDLEQPLHLGWFVGTMVLAAAGLALFVVRATSAGATAQPGEDTSDRARQALVFSLTLIVAAGLVSAVGPGALARLLGG